MDSTRIERDTKVIQKMFWAGFFFLPWLWILVLINFRRELFDSSTPRAMRSYLIYSAIGSVIFTALFLAWVVAFQLNWRYWGHVGSQLLIYTPDTQWWNY